MRSQKGSNATYKQVHHTHPCQQHKPRHPQAPYKQYKQTWQKLQMSLIRIYKSCDKYSYILSLTLRP